MYSALLAAIAGALYVPQVGIINPGEFSPLNSIEVVVWVAVGGRGTLYGAIVGALLVNYAKTRVTAIFPEAGLFALGGLFVFVTIFLPQGIMSLMKNKGFKFWQGPGGSSPPASTEDAEQDTGQTPTTAGGAA